MSINTKQPRLIGAFILLLGLGLFGCDSTDTSDGDFSSLEVQDLYNSVTSELGMTDPQQRRFANALAQHDSRRREPGYLWIVADSLAKTLSDEQIEELLSRTAPMEGAGVFRGLAGFPGAGGFYGLGGFKGASNRHGESPLDEALDLTDEQVEAIHAIHEAFRADVRALRTALRNGEITKEEFLQSIIELHAALKEAVSDVLTDEHKAIIEDFRGRREAAFMQFRDDVIAVRDEVLGLTPEESDAFNAILQDHLDAREVLLEQFQDGELSLEMLQSEIDALNDVKDEALQALLTDEQYLVVQIHDALAVRMGRRGHHGGPDPNGNSNGTRNGNGGINGGGHGGGHGRG